MPAPEIVNIDRLEFRLVPWEWPFAQNNRQAIASHFADQQRQKPAIWNGRIFMLKGAELSGGVLRGEFFATGFADLLAWRDWDYPDRSVRSCFAMAAIETSDNGFMVGVMGDHTANAGSVYFPTGTADAGDLAGDRVDMDISVRRELFEETGLVFDDFNAEAGWHVVYSGQHIALIKKLRSAEDANALGSRVRNFLASEGEPELSDVRFVYGPGDLTADVPPYVTGFLDYVWCGRMSARPTVAPAIK